MPDVSSRFLVQKVFCGFGFWGIFFCCFLWVFLCFVGLVWIFWAGWSLLDYMCPFAELWAGAGLLQISAAPRSDWDEEG